MINSIIKHNKNYVNLGQNRRFPFMGVSEHGVYIAQKDGHDKPTWGCLTF